MKPINNWDSIEVKGDFVKVNPGGYVCIITAVEDVPKKEYLKITYDIAEGELAGHYDDAWGKDHPYAHQVFRSYKESAQGMFKDFITRVEESNPKFVFTKAWDEQTLVGKKVGFVFGEEEYTKTTGDTGKRLYLSAVRSVEDIHDGNFTVPALKKLDNAPTAAAIPAEFSQITDEDIPF